MLNLWLLIGGLPYFDDGYVLECYMGFCFFHRGQNDTDYSILLVMD